MAQPASIARSDELAIDSVTGVEVSLPIAGAGGRCFAFIIDWHIRLLIAMAWWLTGTFFVFGEFGFVDDEPGSFYVLAVVLPALVIYFLYHPVLEIAMHGRTPGKRMAGVRIVTREGATPGIGPLLIRNVFRLVDGLPMFYCLGLAWAVCSSQHVRIGDLAAGTLLVYDRGDVLDATAEAFAPTGGDLDPTLADVVRELLDRWNQLEPKARINLANTVLQRAEPQFEGHDDPDVLMSQLRRLIGRKAL
ncbi:MAG TPA: RDD family protein [Steroidobacteraceae bacterium]|nr:RDD family protein [Steroidobacteraceae bacterium]